MLTRILRLTNVFAVNCKHLFCQNFMIITVVTVVCYNCYGLKLNNCRIIGIMDTRLNP